MRPGGRLGVARGRLWTAPELDRLDFILDRGRDGLGYARKHEIIALARATGRTVSACATKLYTRRRGEARPAARYWLAGELARVDALIGRGVGPGDVARLADELGRTHAGVEMMLHKRRKLLREAVPTGGASPAGGDGGTNDAESYSNGGG